MSDADSGQTASHCSLLLCGVRYSSHCQRQNSHLSTIYTLCWKSSNLFPIPSISSLTWVHCTMQRQISLQRQVTQSHTCSSRDAVIQHNSAKYQHWQICLPKVMGWVACQWVWLVSGLSENVQCLEHQKNLVVSHFTQMSIEAHKIGGTIYLDLFP